MSEARVAPAVLAMLDACEPAARDQFIDAVRAFEGWRMTPQEVWRRIRQAARPRRGVHLTGRRHFEGDWALIAVRICTYYGGPDLVSDLFDEARLAGKREREAMTPKRVHRVPAARQRGVQTA